jgi:hypothetical protein
MKMKKKWASAEAKYRDTQLTESWKQLKEAHGVVEEERKKKRAMAAAPYVPPAPAFREASLPRIPSRTTAGGSCARPEDKVYTGNALVGISIIHKSCLQPIFSSEAAVEVAQMRR